MDNRDQPPQLEKEVSRSRKFKLKWRLEGKCSNCGTPLLSDKKQCERCLAIARASTRRLREKNNYNQVIYRSRKESGLCTHCGLNPKSERNVLCDGCFEFEWGRRIRIKQAAINMYGGHCACPGCDQSNVMFLSIDHKNGDGAEDRKTREKSLGGGLYKKLVKRPIDPKLQVLCYNCNFAKGNREKCPHEYMGRVEDALNWVKKEKVSKLKVR